MRPIENMSVLVTGGGSGIGEGIARHFCAAGARVTITGRRSTKIDDVAASIGSDAPPTRGWSTTHHPSPSSRTRSTASGRDHERCLTSTTAGQPRVRTASDSR